MPASTLILKLSPLLFVVFTVPLIAQELQLKSDGVLPQKLNT
jgi:hypothetical protein